ncbi:MAG: hypothetical protein ACQET5_14875 [Halobacteriota archaeon]
MEQHIISGKTQLSPVVVITTAVLVLTFVLGFVYQLLSLVV